jgi:hypothetical protein
MKRILFVLALFISISSFAQNRLSDHNTIGWYGAFLTKKIDNKFSAHVEYQWRREGLIKNWMQSLFRTGINYKISPQVTAHIGYAWAETFPYGTYNLASIPKRFPEHRLYEQLTFHGNLGKATLNHRLRLEQRWIGRYTNINSTEPDVTVYVNRARYMPRLDIPLKGKLYAALFDEIFIGFGKNVGENVFDQNRIGALIGVKPTNSFRLEGGFINQTVQLGREIDNKNVFQYNNGLVLSAYFNL